MPFSRIVVRMPNSIYDTRYDTRSAPSKKKILMPSSLAKDIKPDDFIIVKRAKTVIANECTIERVVRIEEVSLKEVSKYLTNHIQYWALQKVAYDQYWKLVERTIFDEN